MFENVDWLALSTLAYASLNVLGLLYVITQVGRPRPAYDGGYIIISLIMTAWVVWMSASWLGVI